MSTWITLEEKATGKTASVNVEFVPRSGEFITHPVWRIPMQVDNVYHTTMPRNTVTVVLR